MSFGTDGLRCSPYSRQDEQHYSSGTGAGAVRLRQMQLMTSSKITARFRFIADGRRTAFSRYHLPPAAYLPALRRTPPARRLRRALPIGPLLKKFTFLYLY
ncbi:hypothetical protein EVAR_54700_1 [Eumeta japonica]|uniref:Uncharacterized protein n=1 Tax=Eumeta variegata TaxID=151549 RepID=A0A4C1X982_EUMVA|nr:hypothetical protein EVAR_54700_1 [Eumeta japonica]